MPRDKQNHSHMHAEVRINGNDPGYRTPVAELTIYWSQASFGIEDPRASEANAKKYLADIDRYADALANAVRRQGQLALDEWLAEQV